MKDCGIVKDLLPLYTEDMASEESAAFVKEHLEICADCRKTYEEMKAPVETEPAAPLKTVKRAVKKRGLLIAGLIACLVAALLVGVFARLTKPIPLTSVEEAFASVKVMPEIHSVQIGGDVYLANVEADPESGTALIDGEDAETVENVLYLMYPASTHIDIESMHPEWYKTDFQLWLERWIPGDEITEIPDGYEEYVYAYTTLWDILFPERDTWVGTGIVLTEHTNAVYFEPFDGTEHVPLYVRDGFEPEAGLALPRLIMNYYFLIALALTVILFVPWFVLLLKKKQKARRVFDILLLIPFCCTFAFLFAGFPATTIAPVRELAFVCIIAALLIVAGLCARKLLRKD